MKPGCDALFGGFHNLALSKQSELKTYLNDVCAKGFIRNVRSAAAAQKFFSKVPDKNNRPFVSYRGLNKVTKRESCLVPVMSWLLKHSKGYKRLTNVDVKAVFNLLRVTEEDEWEMVVR